jgi:hypothetical protein
MVVTRGVIEGRFETGAERNVRGVLMRFTITAALIMGVSLGVHLMLGAGSRVGVVHAADVQHSQVSGARAHRDRVLPRTIRTKPLISTIR